MEAEKPPCLLLLFLTMVGFPVMTSLPTPMAATRQDLLNVPASSEDFSDLRARYVAYLQEQQMAAGLESNVVQEVGDSGHSAASDVVRQTRELRDILMLLYQRIVQLKEQRHALLLRKRPLQSLQRGPSSHFLRIGRRSMHTDLSANDEDVDDGGDAPSKIYVAQGSVGLQDYPKLFGDSLQRLTFHGQNGDADGAIKHDINPREKEHFLILSRRSFLPKNSFVRFDRTAASKSASGGVILKRLPSFKRNAFVAIGGSGEESVNSYPDPDPPLSVSRRSYIRIGRLPASVFRRQQAEDGALADDSLAGRRSSGFRLSKSGIVRAGKRSS